jgi:hypothetical protein
MSPLWSDIGLARAARAKAENCESADRGKAKLLGADGPGAASRPVRRVLHPSWMSSAFKRPCEITR